MSIPMHRMAPRSARSALILAALAILPGLASAVRPLSLEELVEKSEQVFVATCESKDSAWRSGNIITSYKLRPREVWKGRVPSGADGTVGVEQIGGSVSTEQIAIGQHFTASVVMTPGEELLLFTVPAKADERLTARGAAPVFTDGTLRIVGGYQGRLSVLTSPGDGSKVVTKVRLGDRGVGVNDISLQSYLNIQTRRIEEAKARRRGEGVKPSSTSDQVQEALERSQAMADAVSGAAAAGRARAAEAKAAARKSGAPAGPAFIRDFDSLDVLRDQVRELVAEKAGPPAVPPGKPAR